MLELGYIAVLEAAAERIKGSTPFAWTMASKLGNEGVIAGSGLLVNQSLLATRQFLD